MPIFQNDDSQQFKSNSGFQFSATDINNLGASEYTLVGIAADVSSSVSPFGAQIEGCLIASVEGCQRSPRADNLLARLITFNQKIVEQHGFRPLQDCHLGNYKGVIKPGGATSLYDASVDIVDSLAKYGKELIQRDYSANGIIVILTDGEDVSSTFGMQGVKEAMKRARLGESLESLLTILVGVNVTDPRISQFLRDFKDGAGFDQYIEANDCTPKSFAKIANFISKSVSSQSQSLGTGTASQPITF